MTDKISAEERTPIKDMLLLVLYFCGPQDEIKFNALSGAMDKLMKKAEAAAFEAGRKEGLRRAAIQAECVDSKVDHDDESMCLACEIHCRIEAEAAKGKE